MAVGRDPRTGKLCVFLALRLHTGSSCTRDVFARFMCEEVAPLAERMRAANDALDLWSAAEEDADEGDAEVVAAPARKAKRGGSRKASRKPVSAPSAPVPESARRSQRRRVVPRRNDAFVYEDDDGDDHDDDDDGDHAPIPAARAKPAPPVAPPKFNRARAIYALMDNWTGHRGDSVLAACGTHVSRQFVPPYSPDYNLPIEGLFGDVKRWLKRHHYWGQPALTNAVIERAVRECATVSSVLARFKHAGYAVSDAELAEARALE